MREKVGKSRFTVFFQLFVAPGGRKVGSLKRRVRSHLARGEMKSCTLLWRETHLEVKMYKTHHSRTTFGSWDVEKVHAVVARGTFPRQNVQNTHMSRDHFWKLRMSKKVHAVVARSTFGSQNVQSTPFSDHFWKLRCWKSARRCGAKHISKSKCRKHTSVGPLLEVEMSKKCTLLWRQNVQNTRGSDHFWRFRCRFASRHYTTGHYTTLHSSTLHYTTLHSSTLHYTKLHYTTLHYTELHCNTDRQVDS